MTSSPPLLRQCPMQLCARIALSNLCSSHLQRPGICHSAKQAGVQAAHSVLLSRVAPVMSDSLSAGTAAACAAAPLKAVSSLGSAGCGGCLSSTDKPSRPLIAWLHASGEVTSLARIASIAGLLHASLAHGKFGSSCQTQRCHCRWGQPHLCRAMLTLLGLCGFRWPLRSCPKWMKSTARPAHLARLCMLCASDAVYADCDAASPFGARDLQLVGSCCLASSASDRSSASVLMPASVCPSPAGLMPSTAGAADPRLPPQVILGTAQQVCLLPWICSCWPRRGCLWASAKLRNVSACRHVHHASAEALPAAA